MAVNEVFLSPFWGIIVPPRHKIHLKTVLYLSARDHGFLYVFCSNSR